MIKLVHVYFSAFQAPSCVQAMEEEQHQTSNEATKTKENSSRNDEVNFNRLQFTLSFACSMWKQGNIVKMEAIEVSGVILSGSLSRRETAV